MLLSAGTIFAAFSFDEFDGFSDWNHTKDEKSRKDWKSFMAFDMWLKQEEGKKDKG